MQKTLIYIAILAILGLGVWYFLFSERRAGEAAFTVADTASVGKIFLAPNNSETTITLERTGTGWRVNRQYDALQSSVNQLLTTIHNQRALYPVQDQQRDGIIRSLIAAGIKVEVYDRQGRLMRAFFVGNELEGFSGTAMLKVGSERPYAVQIPGFEGYLTTRYAADLSVWRDRIVFNYLPEEIEELELRYPGDPRDNFTIVNQNGKLEVRLDPAVQPSGPLNQRRVLSYLNFYKRLYNENYQSYPGLDTNVARMPELATIRIKATGGRSTEVRFRYAPLDARDAALENARTSPYNTDRYYAIMNGGRDTATVQTQLFERLFRKGPEFYTADQNGELRAPGAAN